MKPVLSPITIQLYIVALRLADKNKKVKDNKIGLQ